MSTILTSILFSCLTAERLHDFNVGLAHCSPWEVAPAPGNYDVIAHEAGALGAGVTAAYDTGTCPLSGRYVVIQILATEILTLCEVKVTGTLGTV